jgi:hypothetical protein
MVEKSEVEIDVATKSLIVCSSPVWQWCIAYLVLNFPGHGGSSALKEDPVGEEEDEYQGDE